MCQVCWYDLELPEDYLISAACIYKSIQNKYLTYQSVQGEDNVIVHKVLVFGKKLILTICCTSHFNDTNTLIATQRVNKSTV